MLDFFKSLFKGKAQNTSKPPVDIILDADPLDIQALTPNEELMVNGDWLFLGSSNVEAIRFVYQERILQVAFLNGSHYEFFNVPPEVFIGYTQTDSPGRYHWSHIRDKYDYVKMIDASIKNPAPVVIRTRNDLA